MTDALRLLPPASEVRFVGPMAMPAELYFLARQPVPLAGMAYPARVDWNALHDEGLRTSCASRTTSRRTTPLPSRSPRSRCKISTPA